MKYYRNYVIHILGNRKYDKKNIPYVYNGQMHNVKDVKLLKERESLRLRC